MNKVRKFDLSYDKTMMQGRKVIDVGTGAGFPGIPLKIYDPSLQLILLDSLEKRLKFLQETVRQLQLDNVSFEHMRAEDGGRDGAESVKAVYVIGPSLQESPDEILVINVPAARRTESVRGI